MSLKAYDLDFASFCRLLSMSIPAGVLNGVLRVEPGVSLVDVYLPDDGSESGFAWQGTISVGQKTVTEALRSLHSSLVLQQRERYRQQVRQLGYALTEAPRAQLVSSYRRVSVEVLYASFDVALQGSQTHRGFPVAHPIYRASLGGKDVSVVLVPKLKEFRVTDQDGRAMPPLSLNTLDRESSIRVLADYLATQDIAIAGLVQAKVA